MIAGTMILLLVRSPEAMVLTINDQQAVVIHYDMIKATWIISVLRN